MNVHRHRLAIFVLLAYALSWWVTPLRVPGFPVFPYGPDLAALAVLGVTAGRPGVSALVARLRSWRVRPSLVVLAVGLPVGIALLALAALPLLGDAGSTMPGGASLLQFVAILPVMVVVGGALGEELGWRGFALPALQRRFHPLVSVGILTVMHLGWHLPLFWVDDPPLLVPFAIELAGGGLVLAWLANRTESLWPVILTHGAHNMAQQAFMSGLEGSDLGAVQWLTAAGWLVAGVIVTVRTRGRLGFTVVREDPARQAVWWSSGDCSASDTRTR